MSLKGHLLAILLLPVTIILLVPFLLLVFSVWIGIPWLFIYPITFWTLIVGIIFIGFGVYVLYKTNRVFAQVGRGTLAPWAPTQRFVAVGLYRYVRNPMIIGVLLIVLGEAILVGSILVFLWFVLFWMTNHIWFVRWEEPDLERRFGDVYCEYKTNVPRWIPRRTPWSPESTRNE
jgi:protein-S-isoprenylcysteine O-methyltransferase Ste14